MDAGPLEAPAVEAAHVDGAFTSVVSKCLNPVYTTAFAVAMVMLYLWCEFMGDNLPV